MVLYAITALSGANTQNQPTRAAAGCISLTPMVLATFDPHQTDSLSHIKTNAAHLPYLVLSVHVTHPARRPRNPRLALRR